MHPGEQVPIELLRCHRVKRNGFNSTAFAIGHHTAHDLLRSLNQPLHGFVGQMLGDRLVFGNRFRTPQRVPEYRRLGRERQRIFIVAALPLGPLRNDAGHVVD